MTKKLTKADKAFNIVKKFDDGRKAGEIVERIQAACKLNVPAARTYLYNARLKIENLETKALADLAKPAVEEPAVVKPKRVRKSRAKAPSITPEMIEGLTSFTHKESPALQPEV